MAGQVIISGQFLSVEIGSDGFEASGTVQSGIIGELSAVESGSDSFAATGRVFTLVPNPERIARAMPALRIMVPARTDRLAAMRKLERIFRAERVSRTARLKKEPRIMEVLQ